MKKNKIYHLVNRFVIISFVFGWMGCNDYLDVQPDDKLTGDQVYKTESGINSVLNGIYTSMAGRNLYGGNLTMTFTEVLAQRYNISVDQHNWYEHARYNYTQSAVEATIESIWKEAYKQISCTNEFIEKVSYSKVVSDEKKANLLGEAYAIRAFLHFDMLRLFGPVYSVNPELAVIPYYFTSSVKAIDYIPAEEVLEYVLEDLNTAEELLSNDPIRTLGVILDRYSDPLRTFEACYRNRRLNYYAVKALKARVYLYKGDKEMALAAAEELILDNEEKKIFTWLPVESIVSDKASPDRSFSSEVVFGVINPDMYSCHTDYFAGSLDQSKILAPLDSRLMEVYDNTNDYRYSPLWMIPTEGGKNYRTFHRYSKPEDLKKSFVYFQSLFRLSEVYFIAAECADRATATSYLNLVRKNRGLPNLTGIVNVKQELQKEYMREFYGEGQLFFYYKRNNTASIPNGSSASETVSMDESKYVLPLPLSETSLR